jgi:hypothetical protein
MGGFQGRNPVEGRRHVSHFVEFIGSKVCLKLAASAIHLTE